MAVYTKNIAGSRMFSITAEGMRQNVNEARERAFHRAITDIERQIIAASYLQDWGIVVDMFRYNIDTEDIDTIFDLLEKQGFILDYSDSGNEVYITWDDEYDKNKLHS